MPPCSDVWRSLKKKKEKQASKIGKEETERGREKGLWEHVAQDDKRKER